MSETYRHERTRIRRVVVSLQNAHESRSRERATRDAARVLFPVPRRARSTTTSTTTVRGDARARARGHAHVLERDICRDAHTNQKTTIIILSKKGPFLFSVAQAVSEGAKNKVCPFHMAQDQIQEGAALVFITYQQLVEPIIRRVRHTSAESLFSVFFSSFFARTWKDRLQAGGLEQVLEDAVVVVSVQRQYCGFEVEF